MGLFGGVEGRSVARGGSGLGARWVASESVTIAGCSVPLVAAYVGSEFAGSDRYGRDAALIDPRCPVNWQAPDWAGSTMEYWPQYASITPAARAAYLSWLADGRRQSGVYIGYVFLYFYGLERRALIDLDPASPSAREEVAWICQEVRRLLEIYGDDSSFSFYASELLGYLDAVTAIGAPLADPEWTVLPHTWELPISLRVGVASFMVAAQPIPASWALALARTHPEIRRRTPAKRCVTEFDELFRHRYTERYGDGMVVKANKTPISVEYRPASPGAMPLRHTFRGLPDIAALKTPVTQLQPIVDGVEASLDAYSRYLGKQGSTVGTAAALAFLPDELLRTHGGPAFAELQQWAASTVSGAPVMCVVEEVVGTWSPEFVGKLTKRDATNLATTLSRAGVGIEPDVRFGGKTPAPGSTIVLFELPPGAPSTPSPQYSAAALLVHLTAVIAVADHGVDNREREHLARHLEHALGLDHAERVRLDANLRWLTVDGSTSLTGLKRRIEAFGRAQRAEMGDFLVSVAAADGVVSPAEISMLTKVFGLLGLEDADVYSAVHHAGTTDGPVTVRHGDPDEPRWAIPEPTVVSPETVRLDPERIRTRIAETASVAALLSSIFAEEEEVATVQASAASDHPRPVAGGPAAWPSDHAPPPPTGVGIPVWAPPGQTPVGPPPWVPAAGGAVDQAAGAVPVGSPPATRQIAGLDSLHCQLLASLIGRQDWSRLEFEQLTSSLGLLPDGAIDRVNEVAIEAAGDLLIEGDDPLEINVDVAKELTT